MNQGRGGKCFLTPPPLNETLPNVKGHDGETNLLTNGHKMSQEDGNKSTYRRI